MLIDFETPPANLFDQSAEQLKMKNRTQQSFLRVPWVFPLFLFVNLFLTKDC